MSFLNLLSAWFTARRLTGLYVVLFCGVALHKYALHSYNNYLMFARPFYNLLQGRSLYQLCPNLYADTYKYSPTFAWLMGPFYYLPDWLGVVIWNLLNTAVLLMGIRAYFGTGHEAGKQVRTALLIILAEALITAQNMQSNNLIVGAILLAMAHLRRQQPGWAAFYLVLCTFIKFYGGAAAILLLLYPNQIKRFIGAALGWTLLLAVLPLTIVSLDTLLMNYRDWFSIVISSTLGQLISVLGICVAWFGMAKISSNLRWIELGGLCLFLLPLLRTSRWRDPLYRRRMTASFLLFVILFNKMAESPTYVIAVAGVAVWWSTLLQPTSLDKLLLTLVIIFTSLSPSDLFPAPWREGFMVPYSIKAVPCLLVWIRLLISFWQQDTQTVSETRPEKTRLSGLSSF